VECLHKAGSLKTVAGELPKYKLQEVRWDERGSEPADDYAFFSGIRSANRHFRTVSFVHNGTRLAAEWVDVIYNTKRSLV